MSNVNKWITKIEDKPLAAVTITTIRAASDEEAGVSVVQTILRHLGKKIEVDGEIGPITVGAINSVDLDEFAGSLADAIFDKPVPSTLPKWIRLAIKEIGVKEIHGARNNPRIIEYMNATKWGKWVHDDETPWCAGFVGWCMVNAGYIDDIPDYSLGAKSWLKFGKSAGEPVFGAIAVKSRKGGGHVGFVVGADGDYLYILGGNQSDAVCVKRYPRSVWLDFRIPEDYEPTIELTKWRGAASLAGSEA